MSGKLTLRSWLSGAMVQIGTRSVGQYQMQGAASGRLRSGLNRDRGAPRGATPPTPPGIRVRTTAVT
jgi:hypothetical protein